VANLVPCNFRLEDLVPHDTELLRALRGGKAAALAILAAALRAGDAADVVWRPGHRTAIILGMSFREMNGRPGDLETAADS